MQEYENSVMWVSPECDFEELYDSGRYEDMIRLSRENADMLISLYQSARRDDLEKSVRFGNVILSYFDRSIEQDTKQNALFKTGILMGYLKMLDKLQFANDQEQMAEERAALLGTKHLDEIIFMLETHGRMSQTELGEALGLQASTMSEVLKKVRKTNLIQNNSFGKYKLYFLSDEGFHYGAFLRRKRQKRDKIEATIKMLLAYLEEPESREYCLEALRDRLPDDCGVYIDPGSRVAIYDHDENKMYQYVTEKTLRSISNSNSVPIIVGKKAIPRESNIGKEINIYKKESAS